MSRLPFGRALLLAGLTLLCASCGPSVRTLLLEVHARASIQRLRVTVVSHSAAGSVSSTDHTVSRTPSEVASDLPIRVAITFDTRADVVVHLEGRMAAAGGPLYVATRCYVIDDQVQDDVLLVMNSLTTDADADGWPAIGDPFCRDPMGATGDEICDHACSAGGDIDCSGCLTGSTAPCSAIDHDPAIHPGATEICEDMVDQDCNGRDAPCEDADHDGHTACGAVPAGGCDCDDRNGAIHPGATDMCGDGVDQDCDGHDALCDLDGDGSPANVPIGGTPDCNDMDPAIHPGATEVCTPSGGTPADENCNGLTDELPMCTPDDLDSDGFVACGLPGAPTDCDCNDCDSSVHPSAAEQCGDTVDQDCVLGDMACPTGDADHDGFVSSASGGPDCDDTNVRVFPNAPERCANGTTESCSVDPPTCAADTDHDGYIEGPMCEGNAAITPWMSEACNGVDDNCNGTVDEVYFEAPGRRAYDGCVITQPGDPACTGMSPRCALSFSTDLLHCGSCRHACNSATAIVADACTGGNCTCAGGPFCDASAGVTCCGTHGCRFLANDRNFCGTCGMDCDMVYGSRIDSCVSSTCTCGGMGRACGAAEQCCHAACITPATDVNNCGGCDRICTTPHGTPGCAASACLVSSCDFGFDNCNGSVGDGCEQSLLDHAHCGSCGNGCDANATCNGSMTCTCNPGWSGSGTSCANINECAAGTPCGANSACTDTPGSYMCACNPGYRSPSGMMNDCVDTDECAMGACGSHASGCTNMPGTYSCACMAGYSAPATGGSCTDINECSLGTPCGARATSCTNTPGSYTCACMAGYGAPPMGGSCADIDECALGACGAQASSCVNSVGSYTCTCNAGYAAPPMGGSCTDVNECAAGTPCGARATSCMNIPGSYSCVCMAGYSAPPTAGSCTDIDECASGSPCGAQATSCTNTGGSYVCACNSGYSAPAMGGSCMDTNECVTLPSPCGGGGGHATCMNVAGSYNCNCNAGYANCNGTRSDGCETQLGTNSDCNACGDNCNGGTPKCCPLSGTGPFMCSMNSAC